MGEIAKTSKATAEYRPWPKGWAWCGRCTMFVKPDTCTAVEGKIQSQGYCNLYRRKEPQ